VNRPRLLAVSTTVSWPIRDGFTLRIDGLLRELAREWDITFVGLCRDGCNPDFPPEVRFVPVPKTDPAFLANEEERAALIRIATEATCDAEPEAVLLWTGPSRVISRAFGPIVVVDLVDCGTLYLWREFRATRGIIERLRLLLSLGWFARAEGRIGREASAVVTVGEADARVLRRLIRRDNVHVVPNGVRIPDPSAADRDEKPTVVFTGVMGYPPNVEAVLWFAREVWPSVRRDVPDAVFAVAGRDPIPEIQRLADQPGIEILGAVPDMTVILRRAWVAVAPMRSGTGIKNKVLEAWAAGTPVVMTPLAANGLGTSRAILDMVRGDPVELARLTVSLLTDTARRDEAGAAALEMARERSWAAVAAPLSALLLQAAR